MSKYGAIRTEVDGILFASKKEAARYSELKLLQKVEQIHDLELQPKFPISINGIHICTYIADFKYKDDNGQVVIEDVKGVRTDVYRLKKRMTEAFYKIEITEV